MVKQQTLSLETDQGRGFRYTDTGTVDDAVRIATLFHNLATKDENTSRGRQTMKKSVFWEKLACDRGNGKDLSPRGVIGYRI